MKIFSPTLKGTTTVSGGITNLSGSFIGTFSGSVAGIEGDVSAYSSSVALRTANLEAASGSFSTRTTNIERVYATTGSNTFTGAQVVQGTLTAQTLVVQTVTSSVLFSTGSNKIGSSLSNVQELTGSVGITGSLSVVTTGTEFQVNAGGVNIGNALTDNHVISGSLRVNPNGLFVSSSGNVGIGTTSPNHPLAVKADSSANGINIIAETGGFAQLSLSNSNNTLIGNSITQVPNSTSFDMYFGTYNGTSRTTKMVINGSGNVGIGTISPTVAGGSFTGLDIRGSGGGSLVFGSTSTVFSYIYANSSGLFLDTTSTIPIVFQPGGTERMRITSGGNVGIGTSSPTSYASTTLQVNGSSSSVSIKLTNTTTGAGNANGLDILQSTTDTYIFNRTTGIMVFGTSDTERMRITSGGSMLMAKDAAIGINTSDGSDNGYLALCGAGADGPNRGGHIYLSGNERPDDPGHVTISAGNVIGIGSVITFRTAGVERMRLIGNGRLVIGTSVDQGYLLFVNGNAAGTSGFANVSDRRLKKDITPIESALNKVKQLNGVSFNWDKDSRPDLTLDDNNHLGLIAQDVEKILPQVVSTGADELQTKTITYSEIVPVLIEAIKELSAKITALEAR